MAEGSQDRAQSSGREVIKSQSDLGAGLFLIVLALIGYFGSLGLRFGQLTNVGPGMMPRSVAVLVGVFGIGLVITSFLAAGPKLERWHWRGPLFVLGGVVAFALTIRGSTLSVGDFQVVIPQLGLIVAGPLSVMISALADKETRPLELLVFTAGLMVVCILMFRILLRLPIPIMPLGYGPF